MKNQKIICKFLQRNDDVWDLVIRVEDYKNLNYQQLVNNVKSIIQKYENRNRTPN